MIYSITSDRGSDSGKMFYAIEMEKQDSLFPWYHKAYRSKSVREAGREYSYYETVCILFANQSYIYI